MMMRSAVNLPGTIFDPASPQAGAVSHLFVFTLIVCGVIFAIVSGLIFYSLMRFRWREGDHEPAQSAGDKRVEIVWTDGARPRQLRLAPGGQAGTYHAPLIDASTR